MPPLMWPPSPLEAPQKGQYPTSNLKGCKRVAGGSASARTPGSYRFYFLQGPALAGDRGIRGSTKGVNLAATAQQQVRFDDSA